MVHLVRMGGHEFSVGRLAVGRSPFTESTLTALGLSQPAVLYTCVQTHGKHEKKHEKIHRTQNTPRTPQQPGDRDHVEKAHDQTRLSP